VTAGREQLRALADESGDPALAGYARLQLATSWLQRSLTDPAQRDQGLAEARDLLETVVDDPDTPAMLRATASFSLATTYESLYEIDRAKELYESIVSNAEQYEGSPVVASAERRLEDIDELRKPVAFLPGSAPPEPPAADVPLPPLPAATRPAVMPSTTTFERSSPAPEPAPPTTPASPPAEAAEPADESATEPPETDPPVSTVK
jgi:hypothetical protein